MTGTQIGICQCQRRNRLATMGTLYIRAKYRVLQAWIHHEVRTNIVSYSPAPVGWTLHFGSTTLGDLFTAARMGYCSRNNFTVVFLNLEVGHCDILVLQPASKDGVIPVFLGTIFIFYRVYHFLLAFSRFFSRRLRRRQRCCYGFRQNSSRSQHLVWCSS